MNDETANASGTLPMLHILNGESTANTLRQSTFAGEKIAFRDALIAGPAPRGLSNVEWRTVRAQHLSDAYGVNLAECELGLLQQEQTLSGFSNHEEIVLWFEDDLFCYVNLLYLLDWFSQRDLGMTKLSLISIGAFPDIEKFRGLGQLNIDQLSSLFESRHEVTGSELKLAAAAWEAYCSPEPLSIEALLRNDTSALPFLDQALRAHLARFPSTRNGLGRIEDRGLELIRDGSKEFVQLFPRFADAEPVYGLGDFQFYLALKRLCDAQAPLLMAKSGIGSSALDSDQILKTSFQLTDYGKAVLEGTTDFVELNGIDLWLGGVHLSEKNKVWRWDESRQQIAYV
jgi:Domain of unknown function (DUF1835)